MRLRFIIWSASVNESKTTLRVCVVVFLYFGPHSLPLTNRFETHYQLSCFLIIFLQRCDIVFCFFLRIVKSSAFRIRSTCRYLIKLNLKVTLLLGNIVSWSIFQSHFFSTTNKILTCCCTWLAYKNNWLAAGNISTQYNFILLQDTISIQQSMAISREMLAHEIHVLQYGNLLSYANVPTGVKTLS